MTTGSRCRVRRQWGEKGRRMRSNDTPATALSRRVEQLQHHLTRLDTELVEADGDTLYLVEGEAVPSHLADAATKRRAAIARERSQVAALIEACTTLAAHLEAGTTADDPRLRDPAEFLTYGERRAAEIGRWLDLQDDWP